MKMFQTLGKQNNKKLMMKQQQSGIQYIAIIIQDYKLQLYSVAQQLYCYSSKGKITKGNSTISCCCCRCCCMHMHDNKMSLSTSYKQHCCMGLMKTNQQQLNYVNLLAGCQELVLTGDTWSSKVSKYIKDHECQVFKVVCVKDNYMQLRTTACFT